MQTQQDDDEEEDLKSTFGVEDDWENLELDQLSLVRLSPRPFCALLTPEEPPRESPQSCAVWSWRRPAA